MDNPVKEPYFPYEVVSGDQLREILKRYEREWEVSRPNEMSYVTNGFMTAFAVIAANTSITTNQLEALRKTGSQKRTWISAKTADIILTEIGLSHYLSDGTLPIVPNPHITAERYAAWRKERGCHD